VLSSSRAITTSTKLGCHLHTLKTAREKKNNHSKQKKSQVSLTPTIRRSKNGAAAQLIFFHASMQNNVTENKIP